MTDSYYLIGGVSASPSQSMLNAAFDNVGIDAEYSVLQVPRERLSDEFVSLTERGVEGLNVTMPFKTAIIPLLDGFDEVSAKIGAVNTIKRSGEEYTGFNTDVYGIIRSLEVHGKMDVDKALLIGAGGAARAFCEAAHRLDCESITVAVRDTSRASEFMDDMERVFPDTELTLYPIDSVPRDDFDMVFNASPIGSDGVPLPESVRQALTDDAVVFDAVYRPIETELLASATSLGCLTVKGYEMLLHQGAAAFEIWTGVAAPELVMEGALLDYLRSTSR